MSFWDRYFAPGDLRAQRSKLAAQRAQQEIEDAAAEAAARLAPVRRRADAGTRARRQNGLLYGGIAFTALSLFVTRRTLLRKRQQVIAQTLDPAAAAQNPVSGGLDALHALNIATLNVFSFAILTTGAVMKYFDIAEVEDLRTLMRQSIGEDQYVGESKADREIEGWLAEVLSRKDAQGQHIRDGVAEKIAEIEVERREKEKADAARR